MNEEKDPKLFKEPSNEGVNLGESKLKELEYSKEQADNSERIEDDIRKNLRHEISSESLVLLEELKGQIIAQFKELNTFDPALIRERIYLFIKTVYVRYHKRKLKEQFKRDVLAIKDWNDEDLDGTDIFRAWLSRWHDGDYCVFGFDNYPQLMNEIVDEYFDRIMIECVNRSRDWINWPTEYWPPASEREDHEAKERLEELFVRHYKKDSSIKMENAHFRMVAPKADGTVEIEKKE